MLEAAIKDYATYAPFLAKKTKQGLASLVLENMIPSQALMKNLVLRDTGKITNEEFFEIEMQRIKGERTSQSEKIVELSSSAKL